MHQFASILVYSGAPQSSSSIQLVTRLASSSGAHVTLADVVEQLPESTLIGLPRSWDVLTLVRRKKQTALARLASGMRRQGVKPSTVLLEGNPVDAIAECVKRDGHDLLVIDAPSADMPDDARDALSRLARESSIAVLLLRNPRRRAHPRILAAVDSSTWRPREADSLNAKLVESALWVAKHVDGTVHVLHVWEPVAEGSMRWAGVSPEGVSDYHDAARTDVREELENTIEPYRDHISAKHVHVETGDRRQAISSFATEKKIDLIVIGHYARSGLTGRLLGNAADALLETSPCSILVIPRSNS